MLVYEKENQKNLTCFLLPVVSQNGKTIKWAGNNNILCIFLTYQCQFNLVLKIKIVLMNKMKKLHQGKNKNYAFDLFAKAAGYSDPKLGGMICLAKTYSKFKYI